MVWRSKTRPITTMSTKVGDLLVHELSGKPVSLSKSFLGHSHCIFLVSRWKLSADSTRQGGADRQGIKGQSGIRKRQAKIKNASIRNSFLLGASYDQNSCHVDNYYTDDAH